MSVSMFALFASCVPVSPSPPVAPGSAVVDECRNIGREPSNPIIREMVASSAGILAAQPQLTAIWPGFAPLGRGYALHSSSGLVLTSSAPLPPDFATAASCADDWGIHYREGIPDGVSQAGWTFASNDDTVPAAPRYELPDSTVPESFFQIATLFHEAFHTFQAQTFAAGPTGRGVLHEQPMDAAVVAQPAFQALAAVERAVLAEALRSDDMVLLREQAANFLEVRRHRLHAPTDVYAVNEATIERKEGSAHWVGYAAAAEVRAHEAPTLIEAQRADLLRPEVNLDMAGYRTSLYATGAAIATILERLGTDWRSQVQRGATFADLLAQAIASNATSTDAERLHRVLRDHAYEELLHRAHEAYSATMRLIQPFQDSTNLRLIIRGVRPTRITTSGEQSAPAPAVRLLPDPGLVRVEFSGGEIEIRRRPTLIRNDRGVTELVILLEQVPWVDDPPEGPLPQVLLNSSGVRLDISTPVVVSTTRTSTLIQLR
jgi:hypothetical protein